MCGNNNNNYYYCYNHFTAVWTLSWTTRVSQYQSQYGSISWAICKSALRPIVGQICEKDVHMRQKVWNFAYRGILTC